MKALVISDSHGANETMAALMKTIQQNKKPDALIFCGDGYMDAYGYRREFSRWLGVTGNCDNAVPPEAVKERCEKLGRIYVFITHGHLYRVKQNKLSLSLRTVEVGANLVCFGHTHQPCFESQRDVFFLNPGALSMGYYALLEIDEADRIDAKLMKL